MQSHTLAVQNTIKSDIVIENLAARPDSIKTIAHWHHREWLKTSTDLNPVEQEQSLTKRIQVLTSHLTEAPIPSTFVAVNGTKPIGSASLVYYRFSRNQTMSPWLTNVYVDESYRCQGIGESLIEHACVQAKLAGINLLSLYTHDQQDFYAKRAWQISRVGRLQKKPVTILIKKL